MCSDNSIEGSIPCNGIIDSANKLPYIILIVGEDADHLSGPTIKMMVIGSKAMHDQLCRQFNVDILVVDDLVIQRKTKQGYYKAEIIERLKAEAYNELIVPDKIIQRLERNENRYRAKHFRKL